MFGNSGGKTVLRNQFPIRPTAVSKLPKRYYFLIALAWGIMPETI